MVHSSLPINVVQAAYGSALKTVEFRTIVALSLRLDKPSHRSRSSRLCCCLTQLRNQYMCCSYCLLTRSDTSASCRCHRFDCRGSALFDPDSWNVSCSLSCLFRSSWYPRVAHRRGLDPCSPYSCPVCPRDDLLESCPSLANLFVACHQVRVIVVGHQYSLGCTHRQLGRHRHRHRLHLHDDDRLRRRRSEADLEVGDQPQVLVGDWRVAHHCPKLAPAALGVEAEVVCDRIQGRVGRNHLVVGRHLVALGLGVGIFDRRFAMHAGVGLSQSTRHWAHRQRCRPVELEAVLASGLERFGDQVRANPRSVVYLPRALVWGSLGSKDGRWHQWR